MGKFLLMVLVMLPWKANLSEMDSFGLAESPHGPTQLFRSVVAL